MALLKVDHLEKSFGDVTVLKGISFTMEKGEVLAIIGHSGSGKTTLLRCLNFMDADRGTITVGDKVIFDGDHPHKETEAELREKRLNFGLVFQSFNLFPQYSVLQNITLAPRLRASAKGKLHPDGETEKKIQEHALELLRKVGLAEKKDAYPYQLSGGQQQRVAIARALAMKPQILCFDEPTSALDPELTGEVLRVIKGLKSADSTMLVVTHEMEFARRVADHVIFMADGVIEEEGDPEEVFGHPKSQKLISFLSKSMEKI